MTAQPHRHAGAAASHRDPVGARPALRSSPASIHVLRRPSKIWAGRPWGKGPEATSRASPVLYHGGVLPLATHAGGRRIYPIITPRSMNRQTFEAARALTRTAGQRRVACRQSPLWAGLLSSHRSPSLPR